MNNRANFLIGFVLFLMSLPPLAGAAPAQHPGERLVLDNNCIACHQIGTSPRQKPAPKVGPSHSHIGHRFRPDWLLGFLLKPRDLRPALPSRMPSFRLTTWEATALAAFLLDLRAPWPQPPAEKGAKEKSDDKPVGFRELFASLKPGDAKRGRKIFTEFECAKCHGDPAKGTRPKEGDPKEWGPELREMSRKLTREGIVSVLFSPQAIHTSTKMPSYFFDQGEAQDEKAPQQIADVTAYLLSLRGTKDPQAGIYRRAQKQFPDATAKWGKRIAWQLNCPGCHAETGFAPRDPNRVAVPLGYRNAPPVYTKELLTSWLMQPATIFMHERMHGMGRMPTFGFTQKEARQIADWLFTIDGPANRGGGGMVMMGRGRGRGMGRGRGRMGPGMMR
jgi:mono/diheme cytochrome c family protein